MTRFTFNAYQLASARTDRSELPLDQQVANHAMGLAGETGELVDLLKKHVFHDHPMDRTKVRNELGDVLWYLSRLAADHGLSLEECAVANLEKLRLRYPDGFTAEASKARVDTHAPASSTTAPSEGQRKGSEEIVVPVASCEPDCVRCRIEDAKAGWDANGSEVG